LLLRQFENVGNRSGLLNGSIGFAIEFGLQGCFYGSVM
jgi:hypothetical protein